MPVVWYLILVAGAQADDHAARVARLVTDGWRHRVWLLYPPEKVKADQELPRDQRQDAIRINVARNEYEPFVLVVRADVPLREVEVVFGDLRQAQGKSLGRALFAARRIGYVYVDEPSGTRISGPMPYETGTGLYPDPLVAGQGAARPGRNLQFWCTVHVPADASPGRYEGQLEIRFRREGWMPAGKMQSPLRLPLVIDVRRFALPDATPLRNTAFFTPNLPHGKASDPAWLRGLYREFMAHQQVPEPVLPSPVIKVARDGTLAVDAAEWEKAASVLLDELRVPHLFLPVWGFGREPSQLQGIYFLWHYPMITRQWWCGAKIAADDRQMTAEFQRRFGSYLEQMASILKRRGWTDRVRITTMDEPYTYHTEDRQRDIPANNYAVIRNYVDLVRRRAPGVKTFVTADPVPELIGVVDHWCLRNLKHADAARRRAAEHGEVFTFCDNYRTFIDYPAVSARSLGWLAWKIGAQGWLTYETLGSLATAWEGPVTVYPSFNAATVWGLGQMFYPDPVGTDLLPSLRWELMREGCEDYEYLWLLRERLKTLPPGKQNTRDVQQAQALLASAAEQVVGGSGDLETASSSSKPNAQSNLVPHALREKVADLIERLSSERP
jgi:hypothetical protein